MMADEGSDVGNRCRLRATDVKPSTPATNIAGKTPPQHATSRTITSDRVTVNVSRVNRLLIGNWKWCEKRPVMTATGIRIRIVVWSCQEYAQAIRIRATVQMLSPA